MNVLRNLLSLSAAVLLAFASAAQGMGALAKSDSLPLIPYPAHIVVGNADFRASGPVTVNVDKNADDRFAVTTLTDDFASLKWNVKEANKMVNGGITVTRPGLDRAADKAIADAGLRLDTTCAESYVLLADQNRVILQSHTAAGVFYAIQTLRQLSYTDASGKFCVRSVKIADKPALRYRWIQDDWSRGPIPNMDFIKKQIRTLAEYKVNGYCIYAENVFQSMKYPEINVRGAVITPEQQKEIVAYGKKYHVEVVPQQECLGHMHYTLREPEFNDIAERVGGQVLSPAVERTYTFLNDYLGEIVPNFDSEFVHVGCDEAFELGLGKSKAMADKTSVDDVFIYHMQRLAKLPALKDKKLLFWGDIAVNKPNIDLSGLPKNAIAVVWEYLPRSDYSYYFPQLVRNKVPTIVTPAAYWGGRVFPEYKAHLINIQQLVRESKKYGTLGLMNATWDDMGEDLFDVAWYGILFGAACSWQQEAETPIEPFKKAFDWAFYRNAAGHQFAEAIDLVASAHDMMGTSIWYDWAWTVPFEEQGVGQQNMIQDKGNMEQIRATCAKGYSSLTRSQNLAHLHQSTIDALRFSARRMEFVFSKAALAAGVSYRYDLYCNDDDKGRPVNTSVYDLVMPYASMIGSLRDYTKELKNWHHDLWLQENRPYHWDIVEMRYTHMLQAWNEEDFRLRKAFGTRAPREQVGIGYKRMEQYGK